MRTPGSTRSIQKRFGASPSRSSSAARLVLDYVLAREGLALHAAEPVFLLSRYADDSAGTHSLIGLLGFLTGKRAFRICSP